jgi:hypothetical protein
MKCLCLSLLGLICLLLVNASEQKNIFFKQIKQAKTFSLQTQTIPTTCPLAQSPTVVVCPSLSLETATPLQTYNALELLITKIGTVIATYTGASPICLSYEQVYALHQMADENCWPSYIQNNIVFTFGNLDSNTPDAYYWAEQLQLLLQGVQGLTYPSGSAELCSEIYTMVNGWNSILP